MRFFLNFFLANSTFLLLNVQSRGRGGGEGPELILSVFISIYIKLQQRKYFLDNYYKLPNHAFCAKMIMLITKKQKKKNFSQINGFK